MDKKRRLYPSLSLIFKSTGFHMDALDSPKSENDQSRVRLPSVGQEETDQHLNAQSVRRLHGQDYETIRRRCFDERLPFEDPFFEVPAGETWSRPHDIVKNPRFVVDGYSRLDPNQGDLQDCFLAVAVMSLTRQPIFLQHVIPPDNSFSPDTYAGVFHFRFWQYGEWVEVVIDDRLKTTTDDNGAVQLVYMTSSAQDEFWCALIEKAYAKLYGRYEKLEFGRASEAMQDLTGGITEFHMISSIVNDKEYYYECLMDWCNENSLLVAVNSTASSVAHAYHLTKVHEHSIDEARYRFVCLRNPWGGEVEKNMSKLFDDRQPEHRSVPSERLSRIGIQDVPDDGEFWLTYDDFMSYFVHVQVCRIIPVLAEDEWNYCKLNGRWSKEAPSAADDETYWKNPAVLVQIGDTSAPSKKCTVLISLIQKNRRHEGKTNMPINFRIYPRPESYQQRKDSWIKDETFYQKSGPRFNLREVMQEFEVLSGVYAIVPSRLSENEEADFMVRVFSKETVKIMESDSDSDDCESSSGMSTIPEENEKIVDEGGSRRKMSNYFGQLFKHDEDQLKKLFCQKANEDLRMSWVHLKEILDTSLLEEFQDYTTVNNEPSQSLPKKTGVFDKLSKKCLAAVGLQDKPVEINVADKYGFHSNCCKAIIRMFDDAQPDMIHYRGFASLIDDLPKWASVFKVYANVDSKRLDAEKAHAAFQALNLSRNLTRIFEMPGKLFDYVLTKNIADEKSLTFNEFVICAAEIKLVYIKFDKTERTDKFSIKKWI